MYLSCCGILKKMQVNKIYTFINDINIFAETWSSSQEIHSLVLVRGNIGKIMLINKLSSLQRRENCFITWYYPRPASDSQILMVMQLQPWLSFYITNYLALCLAGTITTGTRLWRFVCHLALSRNKFKYNFLKSWNFLID